jgi:hypothetical protein
LSPGDALLACPGADEAALRLHELVELGSGDFAFQSVPSVLGLAYLSKQGEISELADISADMMYENNSQQYAMKQ